ncbi:MAG: tRNA uridine-5-carboxymethylaminomethyl(34) synthesis GTPase MnmE [bacterium]|nr:tRNA uridine-5-carboxymethylaminomethyl(34) synthesis GTPase MnmE [bacterium]
MRLPDSDETIVAISTPPGYGGIGVIRISGNHAFEIANQLVNEQRDFREVKSHTIHHSYIKGSLRRTFTDEVLLAVFIAPNSYTGENVVEISAHGNPQILKQIVEMAVNAGARQATPGEFTLRAFQTGRIDLLQAEAVADLIAAEGTAFQQAAVYQLSGRLSEYIGNLRNELVEIGALFEAYTDFPDEDIPREEKSELLNKIDGIAGKLSRLADSFQHGEVLRSGMQVPIVGPPNAGKSSLFNAILAEERAIVTETPGTTRDTIAEKIDINGIVVRFVDTAGMRETDDHIEAAGVERSKREIEAAGIVVAVFDATKATVTEIREFLSKLPERQIVLVLNKIDLLTGFQIADLQSELDSADPIVVSAKELKGIDILLKRVGDVIASSSSAITSGDNIITNQRHYRAILLAIDSLRSVRQKLEQEESFELLAFDLHQSVEALEEILGKVTNDDLLSEIFSRFCIGK